MDHISQKIINQIFLLSLILGIAAIIIFEMAPYFSGVLGAITFYVLLRKPMRKMVAKGWNSQLAVFVLLALSVICILLPVLGIVLMLSNKISNVSENSERVINALTSQFKKMENLLGFNINDQIDSSQVSSIISEKLQSFAGSTFEVTISIFIMYFLLYYMLTNRRKLRESLFEYIPISTDNLKIIGDDISIMVRSNAIGIPLVAIAQGVVALIGFLIFGIENPVFWFVMVTIGSMIPFVGGMLGIIPAFIITYANSDAFQAWGILLYGILIVGSTDNIIRLYVLQKLDNVHPLITLIGVIIGVPLFGFIGLIFGPLLLSLLIVIIKIYKKEYR
ncbi:AI-2E family transporter [Oceanihabitans sp. 2_MG-2023]|uniref:AI-2E family transporter n=1 Tax=Oceanihabitans sp. 2_MG-2023 TaxID=3062661 RepID=UPI0026E13F8D|nr:AI-2E family transporter [Oceanihabitans sp. 2_MG-2023]MDO6598152.1 AI-2E family transporter [Oceanihabitans sp. 2_MG-2023]